MEGLISIDTRELETKLKRLETENECLMEELEKRDGDLVKQRTTSNSGINNYYYSFTFCGFISFSLSVVISVSLAFFNGTPNFLSVLWAKG